MRLRIPSASRRLTDVHKHLRGGIELQTDGSCADDEHSGKPVLTKSKSLAIFRRRNSDDHRGMTPTLGDKETSTEPGQQFLGHFFLQNFI